MKKKLRIALIVLGVVLLSTAGYLLYIFKFKEYDVADEEVDEIVADPYKIELPDGTIITIGEDGEVIEEGPVNGEQGDGSESSTGDGSEGTSSGGTSTVGSGQASTGKNSSSTGKGSSASGKGTSSTGSTPSTGGSSGNKGNVGGSGSVPGEKPTVASIKGKYTPTFEALQAQADDRLYALVGRAKKEYQDKQKNGESINYGYFYNKYTSAANELEARTDTVFQGVLKAVERDLTANGYDKSYAQSFVTEYNAKKKERKDALLSKALGR